MTELSRPIDKSFDMESENVKLQKHINESVIKLNYKVKKRVDHDYN